MIIFMDFYQARFACGAGGIRFYNTEAQSLFFNVSSQSSQSG